MIAVNLCSQRYTSALTRAVAEMSVAAGDVLLRYFGRVRRIRQKEDPSSVVCEADLAAEATVIKRIRREFPEAGIIAEESGFSTSPSDISFVIDPLDGTSNFVSGLPWFGAQIGVLRDSQVLCAAMFLPVEKLLYVSEAGKGVWRNGKRLRLKFQNRLSKVLCAFGLDPVQNLRLRRRNVQLLMNVSGAVRNIRATNSLFDFCYTLDGKFGGCINLNCKIWDIVPVALMLPEAGGEFRNLNGQKLEFDTDPKTFGRSYRVVGVAPGLMNPLLTSLKRPPK